MNNRVRLNLNNLDVQLPKNPHTVRTFDWAMWERSQGRTVCRRSVQHFYTPECRDTAACFSIADFRATDWEVV